MYKSVFVAGTFDRLHKGHESLLLAAFGAGERVTLGVTSDLFVKQNKPGWHLPFADRQNTASEWIKAHGFVDKCKIISIDDRLEPAASGAFDAIIVTSENKTVGEEINTLRTTRGLIPLALIEIPLVIASDGKPISSSRVRNGQIDVEGRQVMPDELRMILNQPIGKIYDNNELKSLVNSCQGKIVVTVGDVTTKAIMGLGIVPSLVIVDLHVRRKHYTNLADYHFQPDTRIFKVTSGPGYISGEARDAIWAWSDEIKNQPKKCYAIIVDGEEDLLVLPAIMSSPNGAVLFYGQPPQNDSSTTLREGLVEVFINDELHLKVSDLLKKFT
jgi:pantetheine-phosphate adenylyltransferase